MKQQTQVKLCDFEDDGVPCYNKATKELQFKKHPDISIYLCDEHIDNVTNQTIHLHMELPTSGDGTKVTK